MRHFLTGLMALVLTTPAALADGGLASDVLFLGEVHDNPAHHARQAAIVAEVQPRTVVWEMITGRRASAITPEMLTSEAVLGPFLYWEDNGWPDFSMYYPIFAASDAQHFGAALPREEAKRVMGEPVAEVFGVNAALFGLDQPLTAEEQAAQEALQAAAHCDALPAEMLPMMVDIQRLRDARIAAVVREALVATGGPVVVITGNGHARKDGGAPAALAKAMPGISIFALGQGEDGVPPDGVFDRVEDAPGVPRDDPCAAFAKQP